MPTRKSNPGRIRVRWLAATLALLAGTIAWTADAPSASTLSLRLRSRVETAEKRGEYRVAEKAATWDPKESAIIVCDMWDLHHCLNAVRREKEMAPRMEKVLQEARRRGFLIIHAPSSCMDAY